MNKKLIAIDVDGTVLNRHLALSRATTEVISALAKEGHLIALASGRPWRAMREYYEALGCSGPVITYNGGYVFDPLDPSFAELRRTFKAEDIAAIALRMGPKITSFMCETGSMIYLSRIDDYLDHYFPFKNEQYMVGSIAAMVREPCFTAIFRCAHKYDEELRAEVESHEGLCFRHWTNSLYSEACLAGVSKGSGLRHIMDALDFPKEDVYAFGDSTNDYEMLAESGHPFAMKNCKSPLLASSFPSADDDNDHDGVAKTLRRLFLTQP
jgi:Cof subfamily protein (haloacid dehalogenase superfamily)